MKKLILYMMLFLLLTSCSTAPQKNIYFKMDTIVEITIFQERNNRKTKRIFNEIERFLDEWDDRFSPSKATSELSRINSRQSDTVEISKDMLQILEISLHYSQVLGGYFDITVKPLKDFWDISGEGEYLPDPRDSNINDTLAKILKNVNYAAINTLRNPRRVIFSNAETRIDLGGIAKGVAVDRIRMLLDDRGITNYIVNIGGDLFVSGSKCGGEAIVIGVRHPREDGVLRVISADRGALITSGDYERFRIAGSGARVHHIFDAKSGLPVSKNIALSISGESAIVADVLSTGLFALSEGEIRERMKQFPNYEFLLVDSAQNVYYSENFGK